MPKFRILRNIPEIFEVEADSYEQAIKKIHDGEIQESESMSDIYELLKETQIHNEFGIYNRIRENLLE